MKPTPVNMLLAILVLLALIGGMTAVIVVGTEHVEKLKANKVKVAPAPLDHKRLYVYIDTETGCHYVGGLQGGGLTPRMVRGVGHLCESVGK